MFGRPITSASAGTFTDDAGPTAAIRSPRTRTTQPAFAFAAAPS
ncbi:MAG: hypothetical protein R3B09_06940 [Nannocystaceae bacterium]